MKFRHTELEQRVQDLLADPKNAGHPMAGTLHELWQHMNDHLRRLERVTSLSDSYQSMARERELGLCERMESQLRRISRIVRISDRYQSTLRETNVKLEEASNRDPLTNAPNRRALMDRLRLASAGVSGQQPPFVVAMLDVDHFKAINDLHGHEVGDRVLIELSDLLRADLRPNDICGRWGGEEFLMLLPQTTLQAARGILQAKLDALKERYINTGNGTQVALTMSIGMAEHLSGESVFSTLNRADAALYLAKKQGRDQIAP